VIDGASGSDTLDAGLGDDTVLGGMGKFNDSLLGRSGGDAISGPKGDDGIWDGPGVDVIDAGSGSDRLHNGAGNDILQMGPGVDVVLDGLGNDAGSLGDGGDLVYLDAGDDVYDGEGPSSLVYDDEGLLSSADRIVGSGTAPVLMNLTTEQAQSILTGSDTIEGFESAIGTNRADTLIGDDADNSLSGRSGDDPSKAEAATTYSLPPPESALSTVGTAPTGTKVVRPSSGKRSSVLEQRITG
jgi:Ca2+-binding RTX toxin-like protein